MRGDEMTMQTDKEWRKSSHSHPASNCVELCLTSRLVTIRDSKNPNEELHLRPGRFQLLVAILKLKKFQS